MARLTDPVRVGDLSVPNRLYRAPLLECAGNGPDAVDTLVEELEPSAASGVGLIFQGATIVTAEGGCAAPAMTRIHDPDFADRLSRLTDVVHDHGSTIAVQLEHGGLRSMETWHAEYRRDHPDLKQLAVSRPPAPLRLADRLGLLDLDPEVMTTERVYDLAAAFGRSAGYAADAGYDAIHLAGANMGILQQFLSPFYNRRDDEFGGSPAARVRFLELVREEIAARTDLPVVTKVPVETPAPRWVRRRIGLQEGVDLAVRLADAGYDALVPVLTSTFWDMSLVRGDYPARAWRHEDIEDDLVAAFGGRWRARLVAAANRVQARQFDFEAAWNADFCRRVRDRVDVPVLIEGGVRERETIDRLLGDERPVDTSSPSVDTDGTTRQVAGDGGTSAAAEMVGMARPFYAEPRLPARLLYDVDAAPVCKNCNNCTVPQAAGRPGRCRTPSVVRERARLERAGAYDRNRRNRRNRNRNRDQDPTRR